MTEKYSDSIAEFSLLATALQEETALNEAVNELSVQDFVDCRNQLIFETMRSLYAQDVEPTVQTLSDQLSSDLPKAGSLNYLLQLFNSPTDYDLEHLFRRIKQKSKLREIVTFAQSLINSSVENFDTFLSNCSSKANKVFNFVDEKTVLNLQEYLNEQPIYKEAVERQHKAAQGIEIFRGYPTGYADLDKMILGLRPGHLCIIGARPAVGKTTFMLNLVDRMNLKSGVFSLEMTAEELTTKLVLLKSGVNYDMFSSGKLNPEDIQKIHGQSKQLADRTILLDDASGIRPYEILGKARRWKAAHGLQILFVDYLQLMNGDDRKYESNQVKVASISRDLKRIAKIVEMPVVALAQVNRSPEGRSNNVPKMCDLRESGAIEADADHIWLLHRNEKEPFNLEVHVEKNRFGPKGKVTLFWNLEKGNIETKAYQENPAYAEYSGY